MVGTVYGATVGYILILCVEAGLPRLGGILILTLWIIPCGYMRSDPTQSYAANVAAYTSILIFLGYDEDNPGDKNPAFFTINRIEFTFVAAVVLTVMQVIISPNKAYKLVDKEIAKSISLMAEMFENVFDRFQEMVVTTTDYVIDVDDEDLDDDEEDEKCEELNGALNGTAAVDCGMNGALSRSTNGTHTSSRTHSGQSNGKYMRMYSNAQYEKKMSPNELAQWFLDHRSKVTKLIDHQRMLISAAVFEPVCNRKPFDDRLYYKLNDSQFWMLRKICSLDQCMQSLLMYVEWQNGSHWLLNQRLVNDITPFSKYLKPFENYKDTIIAAMHFFVQEFGGGGKGNNSSLEFKCYEDAAIALETAISEQCVEHKEFLTEYVEINKNNKKEPLTSRGALIRTSVTFAVKKMTICLSEFAQYQLGQHRKKRGCLCCTCKSE